MYLDINCLVTKLAIFLNNAGVGAFLGAFFAFIFGVVAYNYTKRRESGQGAVRARLGSLLKATNQENIIAGEEGVEKAKDKLSQTLEDAGLKQLGSTAEKKAKRSSISAELKRLKSVKGEADLDKIIGKEHLVITPAILKIKSVAIERKIAEGHNLTARDLEIAKMSKRINADGGSALKAIAKKNPGLVVAAKYEDAEEKQIQNLLNGNPLQKKRLVDVGQTIEHIDTKLIEKENKLTENEKEVAYIENDLQRKSLSNTEIKELDQRKHILEEEIALHPAIQELLGKQKELLQEETQTITENLQELERRGELTKEEAKVIITERREVAKSEETGNALREQEIERLIKSTLGEEKDIKTRSQAIADIGGKDLIATASKDAMAKAEKTAETKVMLDAPEIDRAIRLEMTKEQFEKMKAADARAAQITNETTFLGMEKAHANALRKAPLKVRNDLDKLLLKEVTKTRLAAEGTLLEAKEASVKERINKIRGDKTKVEERDELNQELNQVSRDLKRYDGTINTITNSPEFSTGGGGNLSYADEADDKKADAPTVTVNTSPPTSS